MKKVSMFFVTISLFVLFVVLSAHSVRYTEYTCEGEKYEMKSQDFHFKYHLYGKDGYKVTGVSYHLN